MNTHQSQIWRESLKHEERSLNKHRADTVRADTANSGFDGAFPAASELGTPRSRPGSQMSQRGQASHYGAYDSGTAGRQLRPMEAPTAAREENPGQPAPRVVYAPQPSSASFDRTTSSAYGVGLELNEKVAGFGKIQGATDRGFRGLT